MSTYTKSKNSLKESIILLPYTTVSYLYLKQISNGLLSSLKQKDNVLFLYLYFVFF